jgi:GAF domain-containing protein
MVVGSSREQPLPSDTEALLASFTELVATAIANAESRARLARLAEEKAALQLVATLVARGIPQEELFEAVTEEVGALLGASTHSWGATNPTVRLPSSGPGAQRAATLRLAAGAPSEEGTW